MKKTIQYSGSVLIGLGILFSFLIGGDPAGKEKVTVSPRADRTEAAAEFNELYYSILKPNCSNSACHGVVFEPNFSSPEAAYATMVYHPIIKNNAEGTFRYRVVPYKPAESILYERITNCCFVNNNDRMPQSKIGSKLPDKEIKAIEKWILNGAPDMFGNIPKEPNAQPSVTEFWVSAANGTLYSTREYRRDRMAFRTMQLPAGKELWLCATVKDDLLPATELKNCRFAVAYDQDDFSGAKFMNATYRQVGGMDCWAAKFNTDQLVPGKTAFIRFFMSDGDHPDESEYPMATTENSVKRTWSMTTSAVK